MITEAIILAGGFGTRLSAVVNDVPKPMAPVNNTPFLEYQLRYLKHFGITRVVFSTGYLSDKISSYFGTHFSGMELQYAVEAVPLGTGGGIRMALEQCESPEVLVLNGDSFFDLNITRYYQQHLQAASTCSLAVRSVEDAARYGTIILEQNGSIKAFKEKNGVHKAGQINAGVYLLNKALFLKYTAFGKFSVEKDFFEKHVRELSLFGFEQEGYFIDIGIPEDYYKAQHDFRQFKY